MIQRLKALLFCRRGHLEELLYGELVLRCRVCGHKVRLELAP